MSDKLPSELEKYRATLERLAKCIICPKCGDDVCEEKFNLGAAYNNFEGCKKCAEEESKNENQ